MAIQALDRITLLPTPLPSTSPEEAKRNLEAWTREAEAAVRQLEAKVRELIAAANAG